MSRNLVWALAFLMAVAAMAQSEESSPLGDVTGSEGEARDKRQAAPAALPGGLPGGMGPLPPMMTPPGPGYPSPYPPPYDPCRPPFGCPRCQYLSAWHPQNCKQFCLNQKFCFCWY